MLVLIGCDPGGRWTGLVVRAGAEVVDFAVLESTVAAYEIAPFSFAQDAIAWVSERRDTVVSYGHQVLIGVEGLVVPEFDVGAATGHRTRVRPGGIMGMSMVYGALRAAFPGSVEVRPGHNGSAPLSQYPRALVGAREKGVHGSGILRHARSAWDIADAARKAARHPQLQ